jgi:hypothetical protein
VLLLRLWSWLRTGCAHITVVNKMSRNSNKVNTYLWITQVGHQLPVDGHQYSREEGGNKPPVYTGTIGGRETARERQ